MNKRKLILSSSSKPRKDLLQRLQIPFEILAPELDESALLNEAPEELVLRLAKEKAEKASEQFPDALIIGADQVGVLDNHILGKPETLEKAAKQLQAVSGKTIQFFIGLCLFDSRTQTHQLTLEKFKVVYKTLSPLMIEQYLKKEQPLQCAGSCKVEGLGITLIEDFEGKDFTALIGLPLLKLVRMLEKAGLNPLFY
jgi:septum formation protein